VTGRTGTEADWQKKKFALSLVHSEVRPKDTSSYCFLVFIENLGAVHFNALDENRTHQK
jgi:hypothetical protein